MLRQTPIPILTLSLIVLESQALAADPTALRSSRVDGLSVSPVATSATPPAPDDVYWSDDFGRPGLDSGDWLSLQAYGPDLYLGGTFSTLDGQAANAIMKWDGTSWGNLEDGLDPLATVNSLTVYDGRLIVAGNFTEAGGVPVTNIAAWDGSTWAGDIPGFPYEVGEVTVIDGALYAGTYEGVFRLIGGAWDPVGSGLSGSVDAIVKYGSDLVIAGSLSLNGLNGPYFNVARWDGLAWSRIGDADNLVTDAIVHDGEVIVSGWFWSMDGVQTPGVAAWNGTSWHSLGSGIGDPFVEGLTTFDGKLVAYGAFWTSYGAPTSGIAEWNGTIWTSVGGSLMDGDWCAAATTWNGELCAAGIISGAGDVAAWDLAAWNGIAWHRLGPNESMAVDGPVLAFTNWQNKLIAGGDFKVAGQSAASRVAMLDGRVWTPLGSGVNGSVRTLGVWNGDLVAGGSFSSAGGAPANCVARWNGADWSALGDGFNGMVKTLATLGEDLVAGGSFTASGATPLNHIARWDGLAWQSLGDGFNNYVASLTIYDGSLIAGGSFTQSGAVPMSRIARWSGSAWEPLGAGTNARINAMAVFGSDLVVGGFFDQAGGGFAPCLARWDGIAWHSISSGIGNIPYWGPNVNAMVAAPGRLYIGGQFSSVSEVPTACVAVWDGGIWSALGSGTELPPLGFPSDLAVHSIHQQSGSVFVGGLFTTAGAKPASNISIWQDPALASVLDSDERVPKQIFMRAAPNPFQRWTNIVFHVTVAGPIQMAIYNVSGREIVLLHDGHAEPGRHHVHWDGNDSKGLSVAPGVYFARATAVGQVASSKLIKIGN